MAKPRLWRSVPGAFFSLGVFCAALLVATAASATTYYVSTSGSDASGNGSLASPFRTIGHALAVAAPGDEIVLRGAPALANNVYAEAIRIQQPNTTVRSQTGEWAVIQCPTNDENIGQCVRFDVDSDGSRLQRVEVIGGYYYGIKLETKWDWGGPDRSGALNILLEDVKVHDTGRDAIKITPGCDDVTIRRAEIFNSGVRDNSNAEGIDNVNGDRMLVQDSHVHDIATNGIYFKGGSMDSIVERTRIERVGGAGVLVGFDTSPEFFDLTVNPEYYESIRGVVRNNIIDDTQGSGIGLYAAKDAQVWNNTLIDTAKAYHSPIYFGVTFQDWDPQAGRPPSINPIIRNNLVFQSSGLPTDGVFIRYSSELGGLPALSGMPSMDYNLYFHAGGSCLFTDQRPSSPLDHGTFAQWQAHIGGESHSLTSNPLLAGDGHLLAGSPAVDAGTCSGAPSGDFDGDPRPQGSSCDIGADEATSVTTRTLSVTRSGSGAGTVTSNPAGINCGATCSAAYAENTSVTLTATPTPGSSFAGWSGDTDCSDGVVTMNADKACVATFTLDNHTLTVGKSGAGSGTVTSVPAGISCGASCSATFAPGTVVTLTAAANAGSSFAGWSGDADCSDGVVTMNADKACVATFALQSYTLTVSKAGGGSGTVTSSPPGISCGAVCAASYAENTSVALTASPEPGSWFAGWSGDADCGDGVVTMNADKACVATFALQSYTLTVSKAGGGSGTVTSSPPGISCGAVCAASYAENTSVALTASPEPGSWFAGWSGDCAGAEATVTIVLDRHRSCVAAFEQRIVAELWLPVVAHLAGEGGSAFASDVAVANLGDGEAEVDVAYFPDQGAPVEVAQFALLAPGGQAIFQDIVGQLGKYGTKGVLRVRGTQPLLVASRTYNKLAEGNRLALSPGTSFGQYVPAYRAEEGLRAGERAYVLGLRQGASYRSNLAVANVGLQPARVRITLCLGDGRQVAEYEVTLAPQKLLQENQVFVTRAGLAEVASGWAKVQVVSGEGVLAYGSVLDNVATSGEKPSDPTTMPMLRLAN